MSTHDSDPKAKRIAIFERTEHGRRTLRLRELHWYLGLVIVGVALVVAAVLEGLAH